MSYAVRRAAARTIRTVTSIPAGIDRINAGKEPAKVRLVVGRPESFLNSHWLAASRPFIRPVTVPGIDFDRIKADLENFHPQTAREALERMSLYLEAWGHQPVADYFFRFEQKGDQWVYGSVVNTAKARSAILAAAFEGKPLLPIDQKIVDREISEPINDIFHPFKLRKYSITEMRSLLIKLSVFIGSPKSFIVIPVCKDGRVIGKVNLGLLETKMLPREKLNVLRLLAEKISETSRDDDSQYPIDMTKVGSFVEYIDKVSRWKFLIVPSAVSLGMKMVVDLYSRSIDDIVTALLTGEQEKLKGEKELERSQQELIEMLASTIDAREKYTGAHCVRVAKLVEAIGQSLPDEVWLEEMKRLGIPESEMAKTIQWAKATLFIASLAHDLGKISLEDSILNSEQPPTPEQWRKIKQHPEDGAKIIRRALERHRNNPLMARALEAVLFHHVDWDGGGYPNARGLRGKQLPLIARLVRVADSYHTMISRRSYKAAGQPDFVIDQVIRGAGTSYDPTITRTALDVLSRTGQADIDFTMEEAIAELKDRPAAPDGSNKVLLEQLMINLRTVGSVAELDKVVADLRRGEVIDDGAVELNRAMVGRVRAKKELLTARTAQSVIFYDTVLANGTARKSIIDLVAEFGGNSGYAPGSVRVFIGELFNVWSREPGRPFIGQVEEAFAKSLAVAEKADQTDGTGQQQKTMMLTFRDFFLDHIASGQHLT